MGGKAKSISLAAIMLLSTLSGIMMAAPAAATQVAIITLIYGYTIKFVCDVLAKKYGD